MDNRINFNKYDPVLDAERPFDIEWALNKNWDTISDTLQGSITGYDLDATYNTGDLVNCNGMLYVSLQDSNTGNDPETAKDWWKSYAGAGSYWIGTRGEYDAARAAGEIDDDTICYITDDDGVDERIKAAIEEAVKKYIGTDPGGNEHEQLVHYTMLYDQGDECGEVTGGWTADGYSWQGQSPQGGIKQAMRIDLCVTTAPKIIGTVSKVSLNGYNALGFLYTAGSANTFALNSGSKHFNTPNGTTIISDFTEKYNTARNGLTLFTLGQTDSYYLMFLKGTGGGNNGILTNAFLLKPDSWQPLCTKAGVTPAATLDVLLSDATAMTKIMTNTDAINYMVKQCTGDFMAACCNSATAMSALVNNIAYDKAFENEHWRKFMLMCPVSLAAMKSVAVKVPTMTSDAAPSGEAFAKSITDPYFAYKAFDKRYEESMCAVGSTVPDWYVGYTFPSSVSAFLVEIKPTRHGAVNSYPVDLKIQGSNDKSNWVDLTPIVHWDRYSRFNYPTQAVVLKRSSTYKHYRAIYTDTVYDMGMEELQFYGKAE